MTYLNAYELLSLVRYGLNEHSTAYVQGTDTSGSFQNAHIMQEINNAQRFLHGILFKRFPELFLTSTTLTVTSSLASLPADFFKLRRLENSEGIKIKQISLDEKHLDSYGGQEFFYYRYGNNIKFDQDDYSDTPTLWYYTRPRDLNQGQEAAAGAKTITLASTARKEADYYNGMKIEDVTADWVDTISDYSAARVCTIGTETSVDDDYYGLISELPEFFHHLIAPRAVLMLQSAIPSPDKPTKAQYLDFQEMLAATLQAYAGTFDGDMTMEDIFYDFAPFV